MGEDSGLPAGLRDFGVRGTGNWDGSKKTTLLGDPSAQINRPSGCPDGRHVVFVWANHAASQKVNIWRVDPDGSNPKQLTDGTTDVGPVCSRDGMWVYYENLDTFQLLGVAIDGTPEVVPAPLCPVAFPIFPGLGFSPMASF